MISRHTVCPLALREKRRLPEGCSRKMKKEGEGSGLPGSHGIMFNRSFYSGRRDLREKSVNLKMKRPGTASRPGAIGKGDRKIP
jgi:hypothetical protein